MKKLISLILALVLCVGLLSGLSFAADYAMPSEVDEAEAAVMVTHTGDPEAKYYFGELTNELICWSTQKLKGEKTITLLKDIDFVDPKESGAAFLTVPASNGDWYDENAAANPLVFDFNGHTYKYTGVSQIFTLSRFGATFKNGTIIHNNTHTAANRPIFCIGSASGQIANSSATTVYAPDLILENMNLLNVRAEKDGGPVIQSYVYEANVVAENCVLWSREGYTITAHKSTQAGIGSKTEYTGEYAPKFTLKNSVLGSGAHFGFGASFGGAKFIFEDAMLVNGTSGELLWKKNAAEIEPMTFTEVPDWKATLPNGADVSGYGFLFGNAPTVLAEVLKELPFTDVKEGDWFHEFVQKMYSKGIINGMTETTFAPNGKLTYGQALKLVILGIGISEPAKTGTHWASGYMDLAKAQGWITGNENPDGQVSRLAFCQIAAKAKNLTAQSAESPFADTNDASVLALVEAGVISGMGEGKFAPNEILTRAQIAKIITLLSAL